MEVVVEQFGELVSSPKRARESDPVVGSDGHLYSAGQLVAVEEDVVAPASKKLCIEEAVLSTIPNVLELEDLELQADENNYTCSDESSSVVLNIRDDGGVGCTSGDEEEGDQDLLAEHDVHSLFRHAQYPAGSECSALSKEDAARVLRSLEEELGVSSESDDYDSSSSSMPSSAAQDALVDAALTSWGEEIWDSTGFAVTGGDVSATAGCSSGSSLTGDDNEESAAPRTVEKLCSLSTFEPVDGAQVDIGFLNEASDDELGIPPSPSSERVFDQGSSVKEDCEENMNVLTEAGSLLGDHPATDENAAAGPRKTQLYEAVSWALQDDSAEYPVFQEVAGEEEEDWLMPVGGLDFLLDFSTGYVPVAT